MAKPTPKTGDLRKDKMEIEHYRKKILKMLKESPDAAKKAALIISEMIRKGA